MKKKIIYSALLGVLLSLLIVPTVFAQGDYPKVNVTATGIEKILLGLKLWISTIVGLVGVIVIIYAAILYMLAGGDEEKLATAKKALVGGVIGIALAVVAWGIFGLVASFLD